MRSEGHDSENDPRDGVGESVGAAMGQLGKSWKPGVTQARLLRFIDPDTEQVTDRNFFYGAHFVCFRTFGRGHEDIMPCSYSHGAMFHPSVSMLRNCGVRTDFQSQAQPTLNFISFF